MSSLARSATTQQKPCSELGNASSTSTRNGRSRDHRYRHTRYRSPTRSRSDVNMVASVPTSIATSPSGSVRPGATCWRSGPYSPPVLVIERASVAIFIRAFVVATVVRTKTPYVSTIGALDVNAENGHRELVQLIVESGAKVDAREAANFGLIDCERELIDEDPARVNERGEWDAATRSGVLRPHCDRRAVAVARCQPSDQDLSR
jgi:hypothetical protein